MPIPPSTLWSIRRHARAARDDLLTFQSHRLQRLIQQAAERVPYYRRLFREHGLEPRHVRTVDDLSRVAITTRKTLQELPAEEIVARGVNPASLNTYTTSGSSGRPIAIRRTWVEDRILAAIRMRAMRAFGLRRGDDVALIKTVAAGDTLPGHPMQRLVQALRKERWHVVDCVLPPGEIVDRIRELRPAVVTGYPGVLARIGESIDPAVLNALRLRFVCTGGEVLTTMQRRRISEGFGVPVYDTYGSHEFDLLAWECPTSGQYHVSDDGLILEVVRDGRPVAEGECGEVVGTALHSYAMPFIRFELGDLVEKGGSSCRCGQPFSTVREIRGRTLDCFTLPGGRVVHPYGVFVAIRVCCPWIRQLQVTQLSVDHLTMRVVAARAPGEEELALVRKMAAGGLGPGVRFDVQVVPEIPLEPSGKFRMYRSLVRSDYDSDA